MMAAAPHLTESQKSCVLTALQAVIDDAREDRLNSIRSRIAELRAVIDSRMKLRERVQGHFECIATAVQALHDVPDMAPLSALLRAHGGYLKRRMSELRPDEELRRKQELESDLAVLESTRDLAISMQRQYLGSFRK